MSCGSPVVSTRTGGVPEDVSPDAGILVAPGNAEEAAAASAWLSSAASQVATMGAAARKCAEQYRWQTVGA